MLKMRFKGTYHTISNISSEEIIFSCVRESDGKICNTYKLVADRKYEDGSIDIQTTCIVNQFEYEQIKKYGKYYVLGTNEREYSK